MDTAGLVRGAQAADRVAQSMDRAEREAAQLQQRNEKLNRSMSVMGGAAQQLGAQLAAAFSVWAVIRANDAWVSATNQLRLVTDSARELRDMTQQVYDLSQRTASRFEAMTGLYASIQRAAGEAIGSQREVLRITETIAKLAAASGGPESSRNAALFQLRQMLQGSVVQAQEFNSLIDGTPLLVQAIADSLGVTRGELRRMVLDGKLATTEVIAALQEQADEADAIFSQVAFTMNDAFTRLQNSFQKLVGTNLGPIFAGLVGAVSFLAEHLDALVPVLTGVAAAFAVAFAPTVVLAMIGAVGQLFSVIAAHPLAALVGAFVAAAVAIDRFGDSIVIAKAQLKTMDEAAADGADGIKKEIESVDVSLRDMFAGLLTVLRDDISDALSGLHRAAKTAGEETEAALDANEAAWYEYGGAVDQFVEKWGNRLIGGFREIGFTLAHAWDTIALVADLAWKKIQNASLGAIEAIANAVQDHLIIGGAQLPDIRLGRVDTSEAEQSLRDFQERNTAQIESFYNEDYMGNFRRRVMEQAGIIAQARQAASGNDPAADEPAACPAANAAAAATSELLKQTRARRQLFDDLEAQLALNEREYEIYSQTEDLLRQFPAYYAAQAAGAEDIAKAAHDAAETDARRLDTMRRQVAAQASLKQLATDALRQSRLIDAVAQGGADALDLEERTLDLLEQHAELYDTLGKGAEDAARAEAARQIAAERTLDAMTRQAERAREIARAPAVNLVEGLENATDDFWTNFVDKGFGAFDDLGDALKDVFKRLQADILRAVFDPIRQAITQAFSGQGGGFGNLGSIFGNAAGGGLGSIFQSIGSIFTGGNGGQGGALNFVPGIGQANAAWAGQGGGILSQIGGMFGQGGLGSAVAVYTIGSQIGTGILNLLGKNWSQSTQQWTSVASGLFGGGIGGILGSIFGKKESSHAAIIDFNQSGGFGSVYGKPNEETAAGVQAAAEAIQNGLDIMKQFGVDLGATVDSIMLRTVKRTSSFELKDANGNPINGGFEGTSFDTGTMGDPKDLAADVLTEILKRSTISTNPVLDTVMKAMTGAGKSAEDTLAVLGKLKDILPDTEEATSVWAQALKALNDTFTDLRASTAGVTGVAQQLDQAFADAKAAIADQFSSSIEDAITGIENPLQLQFEALMKVQAQRMADAAALGVDVARVMHLNELELTSFIEKAGGSAEAFSNLTAIFDEMIAKAQAAGQDTQPLLDAYQGAQQGVLDAFDKSIADQFAQLTNPTLAALRGLLEAQKARLEQARAIGANIVGVERLNALEQKAFFEGLTAEQKSALAGYLGLIEDFTGRIGVVLGQLGDELSKRIDDTEQMRSDLMQQSDAMRQLSENLVALRQGIVDRYGAATPMAGVDALRERFANLADAARQGNDSALNAMGQVGQQLIEASRNLYGSTSTFRGDYDLVTQALEEAANIAGTRADDLQSQADTLVQQRDLLIEIRDILQSPDPALDALQEHLNALDANQDVIAALLRQYLQLTAQQAGQQINLGDLYDSATGAAQTPQLPTSTAPTPVNPTASASGGATPSSASATTTSGTAGGSSSADAAVQVAAVQLDVLQQGFQELSNQQERTIRALRDLSDRVGVGSNLVNAL